MRWSNRSTTFKILCNAFSSAYEDYISLHPGGTNFSSEYWKQAIDDGVWKLSKKSCLDFKDNCHKGNLAIWGSEHAPRKSSSEKEKSTKQLPKVEELRKFLRQRELYPGSLSFFRYHCIPLYKIREQSKLQRNFLKEYISAFI